jgi:hypothetical protein
MAVNTVDNFPTKALPKKIVFGIILMVSEQGQTVQEKLSHRNALFCVHFRLWQPQLTAKTDTAIGVFPCLSRRAFDCCPIFFAPSGCVFT